MHTLLELPTQKQLIQLRPYQLQALAAIDAADQRGVRRILIVIPTGGGKTIIFCESLRYRAGRSLILVHTDELVRQTCDKLSMVAPDLEVGIVKAGLDRHDRQIVIASVQTLSRLNRLRRVVPNFSTIIIDEAHHTPAASYRRILEQLGQTALTIGFTATPYRGDGETLAKVFPETVYHKPLLEMIQEGYLSDLTALRVTLAVDFNALHTRAGDVIDSESAELLKAGNAADLVAEAYLTHAPNRRGLVFCPTVQCAQDFAAAFNARGIVAEVVSGETPLPARRELLRRFRAGEIQVIVNCAVLTEGFDEPAVDCIVIARPTKSKTLFVQMIGRGTRRSPGKTDTLIMDVAGATERHDLITLGSIFDLPPAKLKTGQRLTEAVASYHHEQTLLQATEAQAAALVAHTVDLFQARPINWVVVGPEHFVLAVGDRGMIHVAPNGDTWRASLHRQDGQKDRLAEYPDRDYTIGAAEDFARTLGVDRLMSRDAPWRFGDATPKQLSALKRFKIHATPGLSRGDASDLIAAKVARRSKW